MAKLLIAAESELLSSLAEALAQHEVSGCHTGAEALALLEALRPDIFILELSLPVVTGLSVLQKTPYKPPVILALTNFAASHVLQAAANAGAREVLLIPCSTRQIIARVEALLQEQCD